MTLTEVLSSYHPSNLTAQTGGFFITGTDTHVGKTFITCQIAKIFQKQPGLEVFARKPIASGCIKQIDGKLLSEDAQQLWHAVNQNEPLETICPYLFEAMTSPAHAIATSNQNITLKDLVNACQIKHSGTCLVEGAGGFYSPITPDGLNADLAKQLHYPVILVVGNQLGCINHCLLSIAAIESAQLSLAAIVVNDTTDAANFQNVLDIQALTHYPVVHQAFLRAL